MNPEPFAIPYIERDGQRTLPDSYMHRLWAQLWDEGVLPWLFYDGTAATADEFLAVMKNPANTVFVVADKQAPAAPPLMLAWLNNWQHGTADLHFAVFRPHRSSATALGRWGLRQVFSLADAAGRPLLEVVTGKTPATHRPVIKLAEACGMRRCGRIPAAAWLARQQRRADMIILAIKREEALCAFTAE